MTTSKKISNKTSLFFEENKQRLSNAKQRLWNFEKWATSPSFTVLLIKHNECRSIDHCDVGACLTSPIPLHGSTGPLCKHESAKWKCLYKNKVWNNKKVFRINAFFLFKFSKFQALLIYQVRGCDQVDVIVLTLRSLLGSCSIKRPILNFSKKSLTNDQVHLRKNKSYCFISGLPRPNFWSL